MNVSSTAYAQYTVSLNSNNTYSNNSSNNKNNTSEKSPAINYLPTKVNPAATQENNYMQSLDDVGNDIMNRVLSDKSGNDKWITQAILDRSFSRSIKVNLNGEMEITSNSNFREKDDILAMVDEFIKNKKMDTGVDERGLLEIAETFRELYKTDYVPLDLNI